MSRTSLTALICAALVLAFLALPASPSSLSQGGPAERHGGLGRCISARSVGACLFCIWDDLTSNLRLAVAILTSLDAILGLILGQAGERIGGSFGRGVGRGLGRNVDDVASLLSGGTGAMKPVHEIVHDGLMDQVKEGAQDQITDHLFGDKATREQMATDWLKGQL